MALYYGYLFTDGILRAMGGEDVTMCSFVESSVTDAPFFSSPCKFGKDGAVAEVLPPPALSPYEQQWFDKMLPELKAQIVKGVAFANQ